MRTLAILALVVGCRGKDVETADSAAPTETSTPPTDTEPTDTEDTEDTAPDTEDTDPDPDPVTARVLINEVLATPLVAVEDDQGEPSAYVELYTDGDEVALDGWALRQLLTGDEAALDGLALPAGGHLALWADGEPEQGATHLPFDLPDEGAWLALVDPDGVEVDVVAFASLGRDVAASRVPDGDNHWQLAYAGTPGASNVEVVTEVVEVISRGAVWRYDDGNDDLGTAWRDVGYDDGAWPEGEAVLGYPGNQVDTRIDYGPDSNDKYITAYFRQVVSVKGAAELVQVVAGVRHDDGIVVWVNGTEIGRVNMPEGDVSRYTLAIEPYTGDASQIYWELPLAPGLLVDGENTVAVEVHQWDGTSSDCIFDLELVAERVTPVE